MRKFLTAVLALLVLCCLFGAWVWYDYAWLDYRFNGCRCSTRHVAIATEDPDGTIHMYPACQGHPSYPKILPLWLVRWIDENCPLPPPAVTRPTFQPPRKRESLGSLISSSLQPTIPANDRSRSPASSRMNGTR